MTKSKKIKFYSGIALFIATLGMATIAKTGYDIINEDPVETSFDELEFPKEESLYKNMKPSCKMVEFNKPVNTHDNTFSKGDYAFQITNNDDFSFIRYGNGETCYVKNEDIDIFPTLYDKMVKYGIRELGSKEYYVINDTNTLTDIDGTTYNTHKRYDKVTVLFEVNGYSCIKEGLDISFIDSSNLKELDNEYRVASMYPNKEITDTYVATKSRMQLENENYQLNLCENRPIKELFRADNKSFIKYNDEIFSIPCDEIDTIGNDVIAIDLRIQEVDTIKDNDLYIVIPCVTGKASTPTNKGRFEVYATYGERYLNGTNADGSTYHVPVKYFFPFDGGIGIHNVYYRTDEKYYAGDYKETYLTNNGTHGCVNIPLDALEELAKIIYVGYPVIVFSSDEEELVEKYVLKDDEKLEANAYIKGKSIYVDIKNKQYVKVA